MAPLPLSWGAQWSAIWRQWSMLSPFIYSAKLEIFPRPQLLRHVWRPVCVRHISIWVLPARSVLSVSAYGMSIRDTASYLDLRPTFDGLFERPRHGWFWTGRLLAGHPTALSKPGCALLPFLPERLAVLSTLTAMVTSTHLVRQWCLLRECSSRRNNQLRKLSAGL